MLTTVVALTTILMLWPLSSRAARPTVRSYAHKLVINRWHSESEWRAFAEIIRRESSWNPCAYYPGGRDCRYQGSNSCGLPQANPCPSSWRGRMWEARWEQVRWAVSYMAGRYGSPSRALAYWNAHGSY